MTEAEREFIYWSERHIGRKLTREERWLWTEQARAIGHLEGEPTHCKYRSHRATPRW